MPAMTATTWNDLPSHPTRWWGLPVLAARTGGIPEAVDEGRTGLLFEAGNAEDLEAKLRLLLGDAALRRRLGDAGPAWVRENFDWGRSLERLAGLLTEVGGGRRGGSGGK